MISVGWVGSTVVLRSGSCSYLWWWLRVCVSGESVNLLLRVRMSLQILEGLVWYQILLRWYFNVVCCSCRISWCIYLFRVCMRMIITGVGRWCLRWILVQILCLMFLLNLELNCLIAPVEIKCLLLCMTTVLKYFMTASILVYLFMLKSARLLSMCCVRFS